MKRPPHSIGALVLVATSLAGCEPTERTVAPAAGRSTAATTGAIAAAQTLYALTTSNRLLQFSSADPCTMEGTVAITGLANGETLLGIDFRPATGQLYGLGSSSRLYTINLTSGVATAVSLAPFSPVLDGTAFGFDFNPTVDRIRIVSNTGQNLRVHPVTGATAAVDAPLAYAPTDANAGAGPRITAAAYTNPDNDPATGTVLYDIDIGLGLLTTQNPPNAGILNTVGALGVGTSELTGFDITPSGIAYAILKVTGPDQPTRTCGNSDLYAVNLTTGAATRLGSVGAPMPVRGLASPAP